jgi:hypothetical protein
MDDDEDEHVGMAITAELEALALELADAVGLQP